MAYNDKKNTLYTTSGPAKGGATSRVMLDKSGGAQGIRKTYLTNADGSVTRLTTRAGHPHFETNDVADNGIAIAGSVAPASDYFTQGFDTVNGSITTADYGKPGVPWATLNAAGGIKEYSGVAEHRGTTTWVDTRDGAKGATLSWSAKCGGRGGINNTTWSLARPLISRRDGTFDYERSGEPFLEQNFPDEINSSPTRGVLVPGATERLWDALSYVSSIRDGNERTWYKYPNIIRLAFVYPPSSTFAAYTAPVALYENGRRLFTANFLSAGIVVIDGVNRYVTIEGDLGPDCYIHKEPRFVGPISLTVCVRNSVGALLSETPIEFPNTIRHLWQTPFINSSGTKAVGLFDEWDGSNPDVLYHIPRIFEIDLASGEVTDLGPMITWTSSLEERIFERRGVFTYTDVTGYSGVTLADYVGDRLAYASYSNYTTLDTEYHQWHGIDPIGGNPKWFAAQKDSAYTGVLAIDLDGKTFRATSNGSSSTTDHTMTTFTFPEIPAPPGFPPNPIVVASVLSTNTVEVYVVRHNYSPTFIDLRFKNYIMASTEYYSFRGRTATLAQVLGPSGDWDPIWDFTDEGNSYVKSKLIISVQGYEHTVDFGGETRSVTAGNTYLGRDGIPEFIASPLNDIATNNANVDAELNASGISFYYPIFPDHMTANFVAPHCQAFSAKGKMLISAIGHMDAYKTTGVVEKPTVQVFSHNGYYTRNSYTPINLGAYKGEVRYFYDPYLGKK
jgi:hypothetical protein